MGEGIMNWMDILKGAMWDEFERKVKNDEFPTDLKEYVLYSRLMRDNKKMVDWYLQKGKSTSSQEKKKLFRLILGEMRRENNFNYWMEDESNKMLKANQPKGGSFQVPNTLAKWFAILENEIETKQFKAQWEMAIKNNTRLRDIGEAQKMLRGQDSYSFARLLISTVKPELGRGPERRELQNKLIDNFESIEEVIKELVDYDAYSKREIAGAAKVSSQALLSIRADTLQFITHIEQQEDDDWMNLERKLAGHFGEMKRNKRAINRFANSLTDVNLKKLSDNLPENISKDLIWITTLIADRDFTGEANYSIIKPTPIMAKKYIETYTEWNKLFGGGQTRRGKLTAEETEPSPIEFQGQTTTRPYSSKNVARKQPKKYSTRLMALKHHTDKGTNLLGKLQQSGGRRSKKWTSKLFMEILGQVDSPDDFANWANWKRQIERKFKLQEDRVKEIYANESWKKYNSDPNDPYKTSIEVEELEGEYASEEKYKEQLFENMEEARSKSRETWRNYLREKTENISAFRNSVAPEFFKFIQGINRQLTEAESPRIKRVLERIFGDESIENYITAISRLSDPQMGAFRQSGSASVGVGSKRVALYSLPNEEQNPEIANIVNAIHEQLEGSEKDSEYDRLRTNYTKFKNANPEFVRSEALKDLGTEQSEFKDLSDKFDDEVQKLVAQLVYTLYVNKVDLKDVIEQGAGYRLAGADFDFLEVIKTLRLGEIAASTYGSKKDVKKAIAELYPKFNNELESDERLEQLFNPDLDEGESVMFHSEILSISGALKKAIMNIKEGITQAVESKLIELVANASQLQNEIPWMLNNLVEEGFITKDE